MAKKVLLFWVLIIPGHTEPKQVLNFFNWHRRPLPEMHRSGPQSPSRNIFISHRLGPMQKVKFSSAEEEEGSASFSRARGGNLFRDQESG
jgi:hypothetical protein